MSTIRSYFSDPFPPENEHMGIITGSFLVTQLPNIPGRMFRLKGFSGNTGSIFIGNTKSTGMYPRLPWQIAASYDTDWFSSDNLNRYFMAGASGSCYLQYWVKG